MTRFWKHIRGLWPNWTIVAPLPFVAHSFWALSRGAFHWENAAILVVALALFSIGPRTKQLFLGVLPIGLVGLLYDSMRLVENVGASAETVHLCDLRRHEIALFGVDVNGTRGTLHDWFQIHHWPAVDLLCAFPYSTFIFVCIACAVYMYLRDPAQMTRFSWCFFALNVAGFITYHLYPAAPPWYFHAHGCTIDVLAHASEGPALARVDAMLGINYFAGMYGRASDVFGAMPSLHCGYAFLVAFMGWPVFSRSWRVLSVGFFVLMVFSAVYLDHHWVLDALAGVTYCLVIVGAAVALGRFKSARSLRAGPVLREGATNEVP